ncbi:MAG: DUF4262 domain-containing protein [Actinomycetota bacterium]|nr:DUF4262 domain-containing protein [Actinomycetota bacterium]
MCSRTIGFNRMGSPDIIVFDLPPPVAVHYLDRLGSRAAAGQRPAAGDLLADLHQAYRFALVGVTDGLLQLVWPDICGTLPWEFGYDLTTSGLRQPLLGSWPAVTPRRGCPDVAPTGSRSPGG